MDPYRFLHVGVCLLYSVLKVQEFYHLSENAVKSNADYLARYLKKFDGNILLPIKADLLKIINNFNSGIITIISNESDEIKKQRERHYQAEICNQLVGRGRRRYLGPCCRIPGIKRKTHEKQD